MGELADRKQLRKQCPVASLSRKGYRAPGFFCKKVRDFGSILVWRSKGLPWTSKCQTVRSGPSHDCDKLAANPVDACSPRLAATMRGLYGPVSSPFTPGHDSVRRGD